MGFWGVDMVGCLVIGVGGCRIGDWLVDRIGFEVFEVVILVFIVRGGIFDLLFKIRLKDFLVIRVNE